MKLYVPELNTPIELSENIINVLVVEDVRIFRLITDRLVRQMDGENEEIILSDDNHAEIDFSSAVSVISDLYRMNIESRKLANYLQSHTEEIIEGNSKLVGEILIQLNQLGERICLLFDEEVEFEGIDDIKPLLKMYGFSLPINRELPDNVLEYISACKTLLNKQVFILLDFRGLLTEEERKLFYKRLIYTKTKVLIIEYRDFKSAEECERVRILDADMCEI